MRRVRGKRPSEHQRLVIENIALTTRVKELEEALAACVARGIRLREVLRHRDPSDTRRTS